MFSRLFSVLKPKTTSDTPMWILVGLGNPGNKYAGNRHNIGFMAIDEIARTYSFPPYKSKFQGDLSEGRIGGERVAIVKPLTYMNNSGDCVGKLARYYKVTPNQIIVFHDELDLVFGKMRVKKGGGAAGHNGLKSLDAHLGSQNYHRVRLGIGHPGNRELVTGYVLGDFSSHEKSELGNWMKVIADHVPLLIKGQGEDYMTKVAAEFTPSKGE